MNFIDIHTHILYGIDDGADSIDTSVSMLECAYKNGTRAVFLTPHCNRDRMNTGKMKENFSALRSIADSKFDGLELYAGCELMYSSSGIESVLNGDIPTLAGSHYLLIEFHPYVERRVVNDAVRRTVQAGLIPIIAHIERYAQLDKTEIANLIDSGAYIQTNVSAVTSGFIKSRYVMSLIKSELVHFVASDAHNLTTRTPELQAGYTVVKKKFGSECAERLFYKNQLSVIQDRTI